MALVKIPENTEQLDQVRALSHAFVEWHRHRCAEDIELIDKYFEPAFEKEPASLLGKYPPPHGTLLLATHEDSPAGCMVLREIDTHTYEMERMFVYTHLHSKGIGKVLAQVPIEVGTRKKTMLSFMLDSITVSVAQTFSVQ